MIFLWTLLIILVFFFVYYMPPYEFKEKVKSPVTETSEIENSMTMIQVMPDKLVNEVSVVCCLATMSLYSFISTNEVVTTPFTDRYLGFSSTENAYVYAMVGVSSTLGYISLSFSFRWFKERTLLLFGLSIQMFICSLIFGLCASPILTFRAGWIKPVMGVGSVVFAWFLSYVIASASAILSKSQKPKYQSRIQSIRIALENLVTVLSSLWMGSWLHNLLIGWIVPLVCLIVAVVCIILSWKYLDPNSILKIVYQTSIKDTEETSQHSFDSLGKTNSCYATDTDI